MRSLLRGALLTPWSLTRSLFISKRPHWSIVVLTAAVWFAAPSPATELSAQLPAQNGTPAVELTLSDLSNTGHGSDISFNLSLSGHVDASQNPKDFVLENMFVQSPGAQVEGATLLSAVGITSPTIAPGAPALVLGYIIPLATSEDFAISWKVTTDPSPIGLLSFFQDALLETFGPNGECCVEGQGLSQVTFNVVPEPSIPEPSATLVFAAGFVLVASRLRCTTAGVKT